MLHLLIVLIVLCLVLGLVIYVFQNVPVLAPFAWLARVICVVIVVLFLIDLLLGLSGSGGLGLYWR